MLVYPAVLEVLKRLLQGLGNYHGSMSTLEFDNIMFINCLGYEIYIYGAFEFYSIPLLIYDVMYDITTIP